MKPLYIKTPTLFSFLEAANRFGRRGWIYRGHSVSCVDEAGENDPKRNYRLVSAANRFLVEHRDEIKPALQVLKEGDHLERFKATARGLLKSYPDDKDTISWLGLMQHFGYPTRLLDFSFSPAIAFYFAMESATPNTDYIGVHALRIDSIRAHTRKIRKSFKRRNPESSDYKIGVGGQSKEFLGISVGDWANERQIAQEGVFLVPSKIDLDIETWIREIPDETVREGSHWIKFAIPARGPEFYSRIKELQNVGLTGNRIYPGLVGICDNFKWSWFDPIKNLKN
jgi:hypothetical protein